MKKNAFTLIELIGVIVLVSLIVILIVPTVDKALKSGKTNADKQFQDNIVLAAKNWAADNRSALPGNNVTIYRPTLATLQNGGYLDKNLKLPSTGVSKTNICVKITGVKKEAKMTYKYQYYEGSNCG